MRIAGLAVDWDENSQVAYHRGMEDGLRRFVWWKDGAERVGACGTSLRKAICDLDKELGFSCPHNRYNSDDGVDYCNRCGLCRNENGGADAKSLGT